MESAFLEEWIEGAASSSASPTGSVPVRLPISARDIAHSWAILREQNKNQHQIVTALHNLSDCRRSLHVAAPQAKLLLSLLSSPNSDLTEARSLAAFLFTVWLRKSSSTTLTSSRPLLDLAIEIACKLTEEIFLSARILLLGCLSLWTAPHVSPNSRNLCVQVLAELLDKHKEKEKESLLMSERGLSHALAGAGYALLSCSSPPQLSAFQSIIRSLLSLWIVGDGSYACVTHGLMILHLMDWVALNLIKSEFSSSSSFVLDKIKVVSEELKRIAGLGHRALDFAVVMAAGGVLKALRRSSEGGKLPNGILGEQRFKSAIEETVIGVAGALGFNFGSMAKRADNSAQFLKCMMCGIVPSKILILQCIAVAVSYCGGVSFHENILLCLVASLVTEIFPLDLIYFPKIQEVSKHVDGVLFKEGGAMTRAMCEQYLAASRDLKELVEHLMWEFSEAVYENYRFLACTSKSYQRIEEKDHKALEKITEAAFFMIVMFFSVAIKDGDAYLDVQLCVSALDALAFMECFRHIQLPEYSDMIKRTVMRVSKSASDATALVHRLPSYDSVTQLSGPSNLLSFEYYWYNDEVQTARIFFYFRILPACMEKIPESAFGLHVSPLMFLYMQHPDKIVVQGSHSLFVAFISANSVGLDSFQAAEDDAISLKEQLVVYYIQRALEAYPCLTPFKALSPAVVALVQHLPAGSPAILYCINSLVEKMKSLHNSHCLSSMGQITEVEEEPEALKSLRVLLLNLILLVDIQVLPDLLKLLAQLISWLPESVQNVALGDAHEIVACSDDVTRKPVLVPWLQSLSFICSRLNSGGNQSKKSSERSTVSKETNLQLKIDTHKSDNLNLNPTCENVHLSRL